MNFSTMPHRNVILFSLFSVYLVVCNYIQRKKETFYFTHTQIFHSDDKQYFLYFSGNNCNHFHLPYRKTLLYFSSFVLLFFSLQMKYRYIYRSTQTSLCFVIMKIVFYYVTFYQKNNISFPH